MTAQTPVERLRADLADAERELERADAVGDSAAVVRVHIVLGPRLGRLRRALASAVVERQRTTTEVN